MRSCVHLRLVQGSDAGQDLALQQLQRSAAASGDVGHLLGTIGPSAGDYPKQAAAARPMRQLTLARIEYLAIATGQSNGDRPEAILNVYWRWAKKWRGSYTPFLMTRSATISRQPPRVRA